LTKNEVLKRWEISLLALSLALPSTSLQIPHQISLGIKEGSKEGLLNAQWESAGKFGRREVNERGVRGIYTPSLKNSCCAVKFQRLRRILRRLRTSLLRRLWKSLKAPHISGDM
jgi:hypothetical protein